ncbi:uncharacterized protein LALA0_S05e04258g [Lachancea lanzarotensis]|uniref:LALA0S05e04258g1_1 n=1 Tax=Lachancea lanzarotensis TaxID=1245769 RepID=A0A0C7NA66_9SACH|nr:uncharacterized protein LALA0_S05e04258g [Lachancea lanzarotensis]CEP62376.1 LALA0S05e04258g1_1 [Lachancea lanzarotensis]
MKSGTQNITPQEPHSGKQRLEPPKVVNSPPWSELAPLDTAPSIQQTRQLEITILATMNELKDQNNKTSADVAKLVSVLNQSLTAISHWSLQAQLSQLENRSAWNSRLAVENSIIKKEMEFFRNRCRNEARESVNILSGPGSPSVPVESAKVSKSTKASLHKRHKSQSNSSPSRLRLVENKKSHPRMRRTSDNPSASNFVRVFHLERS